MIACSKLIVQLESILSIEAELDVAIQGFLKINEQEKDVKIDDKNGKLTEIYILRRRLMGEIKNAQLDFILERITNGSVIQKEIRLGTGYISSNEFISDLEEKNYRINDATKIIMAQSEFEISSEEKIVDIVILSLSDLGFSNIVFLYEVYQRAQEIGLELCPPEISTQIPLQYADFMKGSWLNIAMKPIVISKPISGHRTMEGKGRPEIFCIFPGSLVSTRNGWTHSTCSVDDKFVFIRPNRKV